MLPRGGGRSLTSFLQSCGPGTRVSRATLVVSWGFVAFHIWSRGCLGCRSRAGPIQTFRVQAGAIGEA
eukprot:2342870-Pyramimonas_sp.AAC.1